MKIEILGPGCWRCVKLEENTKKAVKKMGLSAQVDHVKDFNKFIEYGVMLTPALVVDGKVLCSGKIPEVEEIVKMLEQQKQ